MAYEILLDCSHGVPRAAVRVEIDVTTPHLWRPSWTGAEEQIEQTWRARCAVNPRLFSATKFRLVATSMNGASEACLCLGLTDYRCYLGTNQAPNHSEIVAAHGSASLSNPLGCATFVLTRDDCVLLHQRSAHVGEYVTGRFPLRDDAR